MWKCRVILSQFLSCLVLILLYPSPEVGCPDWRKSLTPRRERKPLGLTVLPEHVGVLS